jgi:hypothetical protein
VLPELSPEPDEVDEAPDELPAVLAALDPPDSCGRERGCAPGLELDEPPVYPRPFTSSPG